MGIADTEKQISLMYEINQRLVRRAIEEWDKGGEGHFGCFLIKFVHVYWKDVARRN